jgi:hypothetical protein
MPTGDAEYRALFDAMALTPPACASDDRFILDEPDVAELTPVCERCPVLDQCHAYAAAARPKAGVWAGRRYGARGVAAR